MTTLSNKLEREEGEVGSRGRWGVGGGGEEAEAGKRRRRGRGEAGKRRWSVIVSTLPVLLGYKRDETD
jgi:hypothetical protein